MELSGRLALVTGASSGIGRATAGLLADRGARLLLAGRDPARVREVAERTRGEPLVHDLTDPASAAALADLLARREPPHLVVHNAGVGLAVEAEREDDEQVRRLLEVNLMAPMRLTRAVLPGMCARGEGHLVFVTSIAGLLGVAGEAAYAGSKAGLGAYAGSVRDEVAGSGVGVTVVAPGIVDTEFFLRRGVPHGRSFPRPVSAERVAAALLRGVERDRAEVVVPPWLRVPVAVRALAPTAYARLSARFGR